MKNLLLILFALLFVVACGKTQEGTDLPTSNFSTITQGSTPASTAGSDTTKVALPQVPAGPDLVVDHVIVGVNHFCALTLTAVIRNNGDTTVTQEFTVAARENGSYPGYSKVVTRSVAPGHAVRVKLFSQSSQGPGPFTFGATVDMFNTVTEQNESNNTLDDATVYNCP